jgi:hypothetical protein
MFCAYEKERILRFQQGLLAPCELGTLRIGRVDWRRGMRGVDTAAREISSWGTLGLGKFVPSECAVSMPRTPSPCLPKIVETDRSRGIRESLQIVEDKT